MFFDELIRLIAVEINIGSTCLNRDLMLPSYRGINTRLSDEGNIPISKTEAMGFNTPRELLTPKTLDQIDGLLAEACHKQLEGLCSILSIMDFLKEHTDLTDCHLTAINNLELTNYHRIIRNNNSKSTLIQQKHDTKAI